MNERTRLKAALKGEKAERHAWYGDLSYWYGALEKQGKLEKRYCGEEGYLRFHKDLGVGICFYAPLMWKTNYPKWAEFKEQEKGGQRSRELITPKGTLRSLETYMPEAYTWAITEHFVKTPEDLEIYADICRETRYEAQYEEYERIDRLWGEDGIAIGIAPLGSCPLQRMIARVAGVENTYGIYAQNPERFRQVMDEIAESELPLFHILANSPADLIEFPENLSADITGRNFFEQYNMPFYQKRNGLLHAAGKYTSIHNDGMLAATWDMIAPSGFDVVEAVTPAPVGDLEMTELRKKAGEQIVIWGGIPGALFSELYSDAFFEEYLLRLAETFREDARFVFGVADQVPPDGVWQRVKKVRDIVENLT